MRGLAVAALALVGITGMASAAETAVGGRVTRLQGLVTIERAGASEPGHKGYVLTAGDTIKTGSDGIAQWWMQDDSLFLLPTGSTVHIDEYEPPSKGGGLGKSFFSLIKGAMRSVTGLIAKNDNQNYKVATPVATMGVRGTDFKLVYCNNDCATRKSALHKAALRGFGLFPRSGPGRLIRTADAPVQNGTYVKMEKLTGELCNDGGCTEVTFGVGSGCAFAADSKSKPSVLSECPNIFARFGEELEFEFDDLNHDLYRDLRRVPREKPASPS